jgi:hypothetical protein
MSKWYRNPTFHEIVEIEKQNPIWWFIGCTDASLYFRPTITELIDDDVKIDGELAKYFEYEIDGERYDFRIKEE